MVDKKLMDYVTSARKSGQSVDTIKTELLKQGWSESDVNEVIGMTQEVGKTPEQPVGGKPEKKFEGKPEDMSKKSLYIIGAVIVVVVLLITSFYVLSIMPEGGFRFGDCGNGVCDSGETYETCPQDCEEAPPPPTLGETALSVIPSTKSASNGETFTLDVKVSDASDLFGFQFNVEYDENILEFQSAGEGGFLKKDGRSTFCVDYNKETAGLVKNIACTRLGRGSVSGEGVIETLTFKAIGSGTSSISLTNVKLANSKAEKIDTGVSNGEVTVS